MTVRQIVKLQGDDYIAAIIAGVDILRSVAQGEPCTDEGCFASTLEWVRNYGTPNENNIEKWLDDIGEAADCEINRKFLELVLDAD